MHRCWRIDCRRVVATSLVLLVGTALWAMDRKSPEVYQPLGRANCIQLPTTNLSLGELHGILGDTPASAKQPYQERPLGHSLPGRRVPDRTLLSDLEAPDLPSRSVALPRANTLAHINYLQRRFGRLQSPNGQVSLFNPEVVLVKFHQQTVVSALRVESGRELEAVQRLAMRKDVAFAELDALQTRAFVPNDPLLSNQWHHAVLGSYAAWDIASALVETSSTSSPMLLSPGKAGAPRSPASAGVRKDAIRIAIVDTPFQMDHPDLAPHTVAGWDVVANESVTASSGIAHSTLGAGLVAAVINNGVGVAGVANCQILPITVNNGYVSELCNAVYWAATNGVRVVNISWTGADSEALNAAGAYLEANARGLLIMAGLNPLGFLNYPNHPHIWCAAMTDAADNQRSAYGYHIDFAAPGWRVFSTTVGSGYGLDSGTSYAAPLVCGVVALVLGVNPTLAPQDVIDILKGSAVDKGEPGWDLWYGWGRINAAAAARAAAATLPTISAIVRTNQHVVVTTSFRPGLTYCLWRKSSLFDGQWMAATNVAASTNSGLLLLRDEAASDSAQWYRLSVEVPKR